MEKVRASRYDRSALEGVLYLLPAGAVFLGADMSNEPHRHFTTSIIVGVDRPIRVRANGGDWMSVGGALVAPNVEQQLDARGARVAILQVDPESDEFSRIIHHFREGPFRVLSDEGVSRLRALVAGASTRESVAVGVWKGTIDELSAKDVPRRILDPRIRKVLGIIKRDFLSPPPAGELARAVGLSAGRLIHLFTREMGLPIRRYVLWLRLRDVVISLAAGRSLTEAAHHAGFSDSPHLSRTFRDMFGFPPSAIADGRGRVRISVDVDAAREQSSPHPAIDSERRARVRSV
jgi:AraC-like DNA-binding protein